MTRPIIQRPEMLTATLNLGGAPLPLADYATTGIMAVSVGPRGHGKTNVCLLMAEQLSTQGWVSVIIDPENEIEALYGRAVSGPEELLERLARRDMPILVVSASDATEFVPYGQAILQAADEHRKPIFVVIDEGQLFSAPRRRGDGIGAAADIINDFAGRGRKRALDLAITALRYTGTLHRTIFGTTNLRLLGAQEDSTAWASLAPQFRASGITFSDLNALSPSEFFCISRRGIEKVTVPMAEALLGVAPKAKPVKRVLPATYPQWSRALAEIPTERLDALSDPVIALLGAVAGLTSAQMQSGIEALDDELGMRE
jgi:hypothetical protein